MGLRQPFLEQSRLSKAALAALEGLRVFLPFHSGIPLLPDKFYNSLSGGVTYIFMIYGQNLVTCQQLILRWPSCQRKGTRCEPWLGEPGAWQLPCGF